MSPLLITSLRCLRNQHVFNLRKNTTWKYHEWRAPNHYHFCDCVLELVSNIHLYLVKRYIFNWNELILFFGLWTYPAKDIYTYWVWRYRVYVKMLNFNTKVPYTKHHYHYKPRTLFCIITLQCDILAIVWLFDPANVTFWTCQCDYSALRLFPASGTLPRELKKYRNRIDIKRDNKNQFQWHR